MSSKPSPHWNVSALLVEAPSARSVAREILVRSVATLTTASNLQDARALLASTWLDLVVIDLDLDRDAVLRFLSAEPLPRVPAYVVISGTAGAAEGFRLAQLGVRSFVSKPLVADEICGALRTAIEDAPDFTPHLRAAVGFLPIHEIERTARKTMMQQALARAGGSRTGAAKLLRVSRQLLQHMIRGQKRLS
jgi:DNA-binding NtrC family response regulator